MPLLIDGVIVEELPADTRTLFERYPSLKESARHLVARPAKIVSPEGSLFVLQREFAVVTPHDKQISIVGTDDTTTCCSVILRHTGSGVVSLGHFDGSGLPEAVDTMVRRVHEYSSLFEGHFHFELHLIGGFLDKNDYSKQLVGRLLVAFKRQLINIHLVTACVCEMNNSIRGNINWPVVYGVAVNVKTGEIFPASFQDRGPELSLRSTRLYAGLQDMVDVYETQHSLIKIGPFNYQPMRGVDLWLTQPDEVILQHLSTSPQVEPPHFVSHVKKTLAYIQENPFPGVTLFANNRPHYYRQGDNGSWEPVCYGSDYC